MNVNLELIAEMIEYLEEAQAGFCSHNLSYINEPMLCMAFPTALLVTTWFKPVSAMTQSQ